MNKAELFFSKEQAVPIHEINDPVLDKHGVRLLVLREDLLHPQVSGNKWRKLKYNLIEAAKAGYAKVLSFGGAYSNHIFALAAAAKAAGFKSVGIIRGEEHLPLNKTLSFAKKQGMELCYMDRATYRNKDSQEVIGQLREKHGDFYLVPEGGTNLLAVKGAAETIKNIHGDVDVLCCPCGTGGTLAGFILGLAGKRQVLGFAVLKGAGFLIQEVQSLLEAYNTACYDNWEIMLEYHFGGYAKASKELKQFVEGFNISHPEMPIEPIYSGKMFAGIYEEISKGKFARGTSIMAVHTGGLQYL